MTFFSSVDATEESTRCGRLVNHGRGDIMNSRMKVVEVGKMPYLCLFALRNIAYNEELFYDYGIKHLPWELKVCV